MARKVRPISCWRARSEPDNGSENNQLMSGARRTASIVRALMATNDTVVTTDAVSSFLSSRVRMNSGTSVEDRTPPRTSSYRMFGVVLDRL